MGPSIILDTPRGGEKSQDGVNPPTGGGDLPLPEIPGGGKKFLKSRNFILRIVYFSLFANILLTRKG